MQNSTPDLKSTCGHGFEVCFSTECAKPENWPDLLRKRVIEVKHHYEAIKRITEQTRNEIGEAYHRGLNDRGEEVASLQAERDSLKRELEQAKQDLELERGSNGKLQRECERFAKEMETYADEFEALKAENEKLREDFKRFGEESDRLHYKDREEITRLRERIKQLEGEKNG